MLRLLLLLVLSPVALSAQSLAGEWAYQGSAGTVRLSLQQEGATLRGTMVGGDGSRFVVQGTIEDGRATGQLQIGGGTGWFMLGMVGEQLKMVVAELNAAGEPDLNSGWELDFTRTGAAAGASAPGGVAAAGGAGAAGGAAAAGGASAAGASGGAAAADVAGGGSVPPQSEESPLVREWLGHLRGKQLAYRESYNSNDARGFGGYSNRWDAYLCSDGTFVFRQSSRVSIDTGGMIGGARGGGDLVRGIWRVAERNGVVYLQYQLEGGGGEQGVLRYENGSTYLDRSRVFVTPDNPYCR